MDLLILIAFSCRFSLVLLRLNHDRDYNFKNNDRGTEQASYVGPAGASIPSPSTSDSAHSQNFSWNFGSYQLNSRSDISPNGAKNSFNLNPRWAQRDGGLVDLKIFSYAQPDVNHGLFVVLEE